MEARTRNLPQSSALDVYRTMVTIREFEEAAGKLMARAQIPGAVHLYVGQEAIAAGVCTQLNDDDYITSTHRGHGHLIAKAGDIRLMYAELFGKATGYCHGKGGSMHVADIGIGMLGANGIVGGGAPIAVGAAYTAMVKGNGQVAICFMGDGASNHGTFHEAANLAASRRLPCIFVFENNLYGEWTPQNKHQAIEDIATRAAGYGMPGEIADGQDVTSVYAAAATAIQRARRGDGPTLLEFKTYRYYDHVGIDSGSKSRPAEEIEHWRSRDPLLLFSEKMRTAGLIDRDREQLIEAEVRESIEEAIRFAEESPDPEPTDLLVDVYS
ncbi:MAG: pyruvate dehydrogenase (acetyl-transferring) E1 component subunit alpha [Dehalococcoidia bacterium]|nr:pyruvate dehydrogenase (acetyl-transferring) E1 component subunit alpha [Dehalococcoidia bacterium]